MPSSRPDPADFTYFLAIARHRSFSRAGVELGVTASGMSHALKGLEGRLGVRLLNRTSRSVTLTAAGEALRDAVERPFAEIASAVEGLNRFRDTPAGRIRLNVVADAATLLLGSVMSEFADRYPDVEVDIVASNRMIDVIDSGYDARLSSRQGDRERLDQARDHRCDHPHRLLRWLAHRNDRGLRGARGSQGRLTRHIHSDAANGRVPTDQEIIQ
ncbi:LysR family transcriptional regulator [Sphingomonas faeni]|uniref:LysR family transcriptional regulator n=1 Tax=Sphingomonas faeni TaxID=185950 RepID=UPI003EC03809